MQTSPNSARPRVLIVEDDAAMQVRLSGVLARALPQAHSQVAGSLREARALLADTFNLVLLDVNLPDGSGLQLLPWLHQQAPATEAVVVSSLGDDASILQALSGGAIGYLLKNGSDTEIELSLASIQRGGAPIDPIIARRILALMAAPATTTALSAQAPKPSKPPAANLLSAREMQVLNLVARGLSNSEIADQLRLSLNTVECHAKSIYRKLAVHSRGAAVHHARTAGWLT